MTSPWLTQLSPRGSAPAVAGTVLVLDQWTKWLVVAALGPDEARHRVEIAGSFLALHYVQNTGAAFGILRGQGMLLTLLAMAVVMIFVAYWWRTAGRSVGLAWSCGLLVGGAIGNLIDRVRLGYVVDFISVSIWPTFNLADAAITVGLALLAWQTWLAPSPLADRTTPPRRPPLQPEGPGARPKEAGR